MGNFTSEIKRNYEALIKWFWLLPVWKRIILSSLLGSIGGASIIGILSSYSLYFYAFKNEFRIPTEGVEYIHLFIGILSFIIIFSSISISMITYYLTLPIGNFLSKKGLTKEKIATQNTSGISLNFMIFSYIFIMILVSSAHFSELPEEMPYLFSDRGYLIFIIVFSAFLFFLIAVRFFTKEDNRKYISLISAIVIVLFFLISIFNQNNYKMILFKSKFGGEIPIEIEYRKADNTAALLKGNLLLRTREFLIIKKESDIFEIPMERVSLIKN